MNPEEFSDALDDALPPKPAMTGWGARARRRSRDRRAAALTGTVGVVAVAVVLATIQFGGQPPLTATPAPADSQPSVPGFTALVPDACEGPLEGQHDVAELPGDGQLPDGVEAVWLCGGEGDWDAELVGAAEPLTLNAEAAVAAFNAEPTSSSAIDCDGGGSEHFTVVYAYPDGSRYEALVRRGTYVGRGCNAVSVGSRLRVDPQAYMKVLDSLWDEQRSAVGPTFVPGDDVCPGRASVFDVTPNDGVSGFICTLPDEGSGEAEQIRLSDELVADIAAEIRVTDSGPEPGLDRSAPSLVLLGEYGDPFTIFGTPEQGYHWYPPRNPGGMQHWIPSEGIRERMLAEIVDAAASVPPSGTKAPEPSTNLTVDCAVEGGVAGAEELARMTRGVVCVPLQTEMEPEWHAIKLSDELVAEVVARAGLEAQTSPAPTDRTDQLRYPLAGLVLSGPDGAVKLSGSPIGFGWRWPGGLVASWVPSPGLAEEMWGEITRDGACVRPANLSVSEVPVHVYDAGGGPEAVASVVAHFTGAGFPVTDTGETATVDTAAPLTVRGGYANGQTVPLVGSWLGDFWAEMSRDDGVVDLLVTHEFTPAVLVQGEPEVVNGQLTCS